MDWSGDSQCCIEMAEAAKCLVCLGGPLPVGPRAKSKLNRLCAKHQAALKKAVGSGSAGTGAARPSSARCRGAQPRRKTLKKTGSVQSVGSVVEEKKLKELSQHAKRSITFIETRLRTISSLYKRQHHQYLRGETLGPDVRCLCVVGANRLWVASRDGSIHIRAFDTGKQLRDIRYSSGKTKDPEKFQINAIYPHTESGRVWVGTSDGLLHVYDMTGSKHLQQINEHSGGIKCITGTDEALWSSSEDFTILQRHPRTGQFVKKLVGHTSWVSSMVFVASENQLWSGSADGIRVWDPTPPPEEEEEAKEHAAAKLARAKTFADLRSAKKDASKPAADSAVPDHACADCLHLLTSHSSAVTALCVVKDNVWSGDQDGRVLIWNPKTRKVVRRLKAHKGPITNITHVGQDVWTSSIDKTIAAWSQAGDKTDNIPLNAEEEKAKLYIQKGRLRVSDMVYSQGRLWLGCRAQGSIHLFRIFHPTQDERLPLWQPRDMKPDPPKLAPLPVAAPPVEPQVDDLDHEARLKLTLQQLVDLWNDEQTGPHTRLYPAEPPTDKEGVYLCGKRRLRLVALDGYVMVRVGGGYVTIEQFVVNNAAHFRHLRRQATQQALNALSHSMSAPVFSTGSTSTTSTPRDARKPKRSAGSSASTRRASGVRVRPSASQLQQALKGRIKGPAARLASATDAGHTTSTRKANTTWTARRSKDGKEVEITEEVVLDASKLHATESKLAEAQKAIKRLEAEKQAERDFSYKLLGFLAHPEAKAQSVLALIDADTNDEEFAARVRTRMVEVLQQRKAAEQQ